jgi:hypothetical protein
MADLPLPNPFSWSIMSQIGNLNNLRKQTLENKYAPLDKAIKAQNALSYGSRQGNIGMFLRSLSQMPVEERQAYLADPTNRANYMKMLEDFRAGINSTTGGGNLLSPEYVRSFGIGDNSEDNPLYNLGRFFYNSVTGNNNTPSNPISRVNQEYGQQNKMSNQELKDFVNDRTGSADDNTESIEASNTPNKTVKIAGQDMQVVPLAGTGAPPNNQQTTQQNNKQDEDNNTPKELTKEERGLLRSQEITNNKTVGTKIKNRADSAIAFDDFLKKHRDKIAKVFRDAYKYSGIYGRGKNWMEKFKSNQPEEYKNYLVAKRSLTPIMSNGVRFLEDMGVSHDAQQDAKQQIASGLDALDTSPETAVKIFNEHMDAMEDLTDGVLNAAEPAFPGVRRRLHNLPRRKGEYIPKESDNTNSSSIPKGRMKVISPEGIEGHISTNKWQEAEKAGYKRA